MAEKRFTYIKNALITQYQSIPIQKIGKGKAFHCQGVVDELNKLWNENEQLKQRIKSRLHYYRELCNDFDKDDGFTYYIVERIVEDLEDILK